MAQRRSAGRSHSRAASGQDGGSSLQGALGWAALITIFVFTAFLGANRPVSWVSMSVIIGLLFLAQAARDVFGGSPARLFGRLWPAALLYLGALGWGAFQLSSLTPAEWAHPVWQVFPELTLRIGVDPTQGRHVLMRLLAYAMLFWILARSAARRDRAQNYIRAIAIWSGLLATYGLIALFAGVNPALELERPARATSATFINRNAYALYAGFGVMANLAALAMTFKEQAATASLTARVRRAIDHLIAGGWIYSFSLVLCAAALATTASRAGIIASILGVAFFFLALRRGGGGRLGVATGIAVLIFAFIAATSLSQFADRLALLVDTEEEVRFVAYEAAINGIADRPWLGYGPGGFEDGIRAYAPLEMAIGEWRQAHNSYLENAFELGIPAAVAFYLSFLLIGWRIRAGVGSSRKNVAAPCLALGCMVAAAFHSLVDFPLQMPASAALFAAILGIGWAQSIRRSGA